MFKRRRRITVEDAFNDASVEIDAKETDGEEEYSSIRPVNILSCPKYIERYTGRVIGKSCLELWW